MLRTVGFDDETRLEADEVEDVAIERHLPFELKPLEPVRAEELPEPALGVRCVRPQRLGSTATAGRDAGSHAYIPLSWIFSDLASPRSRKSILPRKGGEAPTAS
jgi:hypothetical protein